MKNGEVKNYIIRGLLFILGLFLVSLNYNMFLLPNNLVIGGTSGIAILIKNYIDPVIFLYSINGILIIVSFIFLGKKKTLRSLIGAFLYPLFISITYPIALFLNVSFENNLVLVLVSAFLLGVGNGLIYKTGFTTGGSDIIIQLINEKRKLSMGTSILVTNVLIILLGGYIFGYEKVVYAIMILFINSLLVDKILLGISDSKMFFIYTKELSKLKQFVVKELETGITVLDVTGGYSKRHQDMIMCVVRTRDYVLFKEKIMEIDPKAFLVINDCYEVMGGVKRHNLPFIYFN